MRRYIGKKRMALCLAFFMAMSFVPSDVLAMESDLAEQISEEKILEETVDTEAGNVQQIRVQEEQQELIEESSEVDETSDILSEQSEKEQQEEASEELDVYDMYRDGSGKNIESGEEIPDSLQRNQDTIQSVGGMSIEKAGLDLIKSFESCRLTAYKAVSTEKYYTIGWGHYGPDVTKGMTITQARADQLLAQDVSKFEGYVNTFSRTNGVDLNQNQFDALVSFTYNVGTSWMTKSTLRSYLVSGIEQYTNTQITNAFLMWNKSGGKVLSGLTRRRKAEAELFLKKVTSASSSFPTISSYNTPSTINQGSSFSIKGLVSSSTMLKEVSVGVYDQNGNLSTGKTVNPNTKSYSLANIDDDIVFGKLKAGVYQYIVSATNTKGTKELVNQKFEVVCSHSYDTETTTKAKPTTNGKTTGKCSKCGTEVESTIYAPKTMKLSTTSYTYTGKAKKPSVTITDSQGKTIDSSHYTVSYEAGRINVGTYKVTAKFDSSLYEGSISKTITINPASQTITGTKTYTKNTSSSAFTVDAKLTKGDSKLSYASNNKSVATINSSTGKVTIKGVGTAVITATAPATSNYKATTYQITIKVNPTKVTLKSATSPYAGKMLVKWAQNTKTTGYQISYATNSSFSNDKKLNISGSSSLYKTISSLTKGRKYYVRVRCYKTVDGVKYYSAYSNIKSVTIKK